jgi:hypothetical protein
MQTDSSSSDVMLCTQCNKPFTDKENVVSISGSIMGDECTDSYFFCLLCGVYTVVSWRDNFTGVETGSRSGPVEKGAGDKQVELIKKCDTPWDKKCRCEAHRTYFQGALD